MRRLATALALAAFAGPSWSQPPALRSQVTPDGAVLVAMGEQVTVRLPVDGPPVLVSAEVAPAGAAAPPRPGQGAFEDAPEGSVVITLQRSGDAEVMMKVLSGVSKAFDYRARLLPEGDPVGVCTVLPLLQNYERWQNQGPASGILLTGFEFRDTNEVVCPQPQEAK